MATQFKVQHGSAKAETVDQQGLDALKEAFGRRFSDFTVTEVKEPTKPADLSKSEASGSKAKTATTE